MTQKLKYALLGFLVAALGLWGLAVTIPNTFADGDVVSSSKMNQNFQALKNAVDTLEAKVATLEDKLSAVGPGQKALASKDGAMGRALVRWNGGGSVSIDNDWSFNSSGAGIVPARTGTGTYQVDFLDLAATGTPFGTAVASTRDDTGVRCEAWSVKNESVTSPDVRVLVECRDAAGTLTDTSFRVLYVR